MDANFEYQDIENPFNDFGDDFEADPNNSITKYHLFNKELSEIDDYGIYDYFKYCDTYTRLKMVTDIHPYLYVINTEGGYHADHLRMSVDNRSRFGSSNCFLGSVGDEINVFGNGELSSNQYHMLIGVFSELKRYYFETNSNKKIAFVGNAFGNELDGFKDCSNIDELIEKLTELKNAAKLDEPIFFPDDNIPVL